MTETLSDKRKETELSNFGIYEEEDVKEFIKKLKEDLKIELANMEYKEDEEDIIDSVINKLAGDELI